MKLQPTKAFLHRDGKNVTHLGGTWRITFPIEKLDHWLAFYTRMADPKYCKKGWMHYGKDVEVLTAIKLKLQQEGPKL